MKISSSSPFNFFKTWARAWQTFFLLTEPYSSQSFDRLKKFIFYNEHLRVTWLGHVMYLRVWESSNSMNRDTLSNNGINISVEILGSDWWMVVTIGKWDKDFLWVWSRLKNNRKLVDWNSTGSQPEVIIYLSEFVIDMLESFIDIGTLWSKWWNIDIVNDSFFVVCQFFEIEWIWITEWNNGFNSVGEGNDGYIDFFFAYHVMKIFKSYLGVLRLTYGVRDRLQKFQGW